MTRIELYEKYLLGDKREDYWEDLGIAPPESEYGYRRTMPMIDQIERPIEIPDNKKEFIVQFWGGEQLVCLGNYDVFCLKLHDIEEQMMIEQEELLFEMANANRE